MMTNTQARSTFQVKTWEESTCSEVDGRLKVTRAEVKFQYSDDLEGESAMEYLMLYRDDGSARVIGIKRVTGRVMGRSGAFVLEHRGAYADGIASSDVEVVEGSGELAGLGGHGRSVARKDGTTELTLDYAIG